VRKLYRTVFFRGAAMKKKIRQIVVDGNVYFWKFSPGYVRTADPVTPWQCHDIFTAYAFGAKRSPLQVHCVTWEDAVIGGPLRAGYALDLSNPGGDGPHLHQPGWAAKVIRLALSVGWQPEQSQKPFIIEEGVEFLKRLPK
jgi:hypothetical protein